MSVACRGVLVSTRWNPGRHLGLVNRESLGWVHQSPCAHEPKWRLRQRGGWIRFPSKTPVLQAKYNRAHSLVDFLAPPIIFFSPLLLLFVLSIFLFSCEVSWRAQPEKHWTPLTKSVTSSWGRCWLDRNGSSNSGIGAPPPWSSLVTNTKAFPSSFPLRGILSICPIISCSSWKWV